MDIYVYDRELKKIGVIDSYESCIWNTFYFGQGDFELYLPATSDHVNLLQKDRYLIRSQDIGADGHKDKVMIIRNITITTDSVNGNYLTVTGNCLKCILWRRVVWSQTNLTGKVENCLRRLITDNVINPDIADRVIPNLCLGRVNGWTETMSRQMTGANLGDAIVDICTAYGIGWRAYLDANNRITMEFYKGVDRSDNQDTNPRVTFSTEYDSLLTSNYVLDGTEYRNVALVAGEGEGSTRKTKTVGVASGLDRYELYVDARDQSTNDGQITLTEYYSQLEQRGSEALEETAYTESFEGEVENYGNWIYGRDYQLGDVVNVKNEYGIKGTPRIIGVIESNSTEGESIIPTFSTWR